MNSGREGIVDGELQEVNSDTVAALVPRWKGIETNGKGLGNETWESCGNWE